MTIRSQFLTVARFNRLPAEIAAKCRFHAPLLYSLDYKGIEPAVFARPTANPATWRDGAAHTVAAGAPRFEYTGETPLGILIDSTLSETLQFSAQNLLHDSFTLIWIEESTPKQTPWDTNPFDASGNLLGTDQVHRRQIFKAAEHLTPAERALIINLLEDSAVYAGSGEKTGSDAVAAGATSHVVTHNLNNPAALVDGETDWPTVKRISARAANSTTLVFSDPAPSGGGTIDWSAEI